MSPAVVNIATVVRLEMSHSRRAQTARRLTGGAMLALCVGLAIERAGAQQQQQQTSPGANVNVIAGTGADGDWTLQRQNEPSIACSSRNPRNCIAGANDYRTVDIPFPAVGERVTGDAWLGWYTTKDGGLSWRTRLLPGFPQDTSTVGLNSPLRGYGAGADPIIRPGTNGLFYYGGLVFDREEGGGSAIFVARFIDNNNQEGTAGESIDYVGASIVHRIGAVPTVARRQERGARASTRVARREERDNKKRKPSVRAGAEQAAEQMVDKPWMAVDIPRPGAQICTIGGGNTGVPLQSFPGGRVYMAWALFDGPGEERGQIMFSRSADCGRTWSTPRIISKVPSADVNGDGIASSADTNLVRASYGRTCGQTGFNPNADVINDCSINALDLNYVSRLVGTPVPVQPRLSQGAALAINPLTGAVHIAWRQFDDGAKPDAIVTVQSVDGGNTFTAPTVVSTLSPFEQRTLENRTFRTNAFPALAIDGTGRAYLAWSARGFAPDRPSRDGRIVVSTSDNGVTWSPPVAVDDQNNPGHQFMPALAFAQGKLQLIYYDLREDYSQLFGEFVDEGPILDGTHSPGLRHTIDVWAAQADPGPSPSFTPFRLSQYREGAVPGVLGINQLEFSPPNLPIFRSGTSPFMGDYLDVATEAPFVRNGSTWSFNTAATASPVFHGIWTDNRDVRPPGNGVWTDYTPPNPPDFARPTQSGFDPGQTVPPCVPGQAGMRNQNIYTARITRGLVVGALGNSRTLSPTLQRSFPVFAQNNSTFVRTYRLTIAPPAAGVQASFKQFEQLATLDVQVPARSTVARTVFARSTDPHAQINVGVVEITAPEGAPVPNGQQGTIVLNPDPTNPELENPELENPELENPELENAEVHNLDMANPTVRNPELENPELENPELENPELENATVVNPSILNPELENPELENPELENPELENPELENVDLINGSLSDTTWTITNNGNTSGAYTVKLGLNGQLPAGFRSQLIAHKIYQTPVVLGCSLLNQTQTVLLANIPSPRFVTADEFLNPELENPELENLTIAIAPGETARITLRVFDPDKTDAVTFRAADNVTPVAVAQAVNTPEADLGITQPEVAGVLTSNAPVPDSGLGTSYTTTLPSTVPGTWTVSGGSLPPGLTLNETTGGITGTPTTPGTYTFTARFTSTTGLTDYQTVTITVAGAGALANVGVAASAPPTIAIGTPFAFTINVSNAGPAAATNVVLQDTLPEGATFVSATTSSGSCTQANGLVRCTLGTLAGGGTATISVTVNPTIAGPHQNTAVVSADQADPVATNNTAVTTASTQTVTACTTVCFSGPTSFIAGDFDLEFGAEKGDFNEDGYLDLVYGPVGVNTIGILLNNGAGGFGPHATMTIPGSPDGGAVADFDNDGHLDVVVVSHDVAQAWLLLGNGLGTFAAPVTIPLANGSETVVTADFNHDGNADLALGSSGVGPVITVRLGNGNGTFQAPITFGATTTLSAVLVDDFNNDGNPDLAAHNDGVGLMIVLGNGASGFQPPTSIALLGASGVIKVGDLTGDGFADLMVGIVSPTENVLRLFVGNGSGGFTPSADMGGGGTDESPVVGDLDSDGDIDLVWPREGGGIVIQLNDGTGTFATTLYLATPPISLPVVADLNNDGRPDIVAPLGGAFQSQVLVFLNTCDQPPADLAVTLQGPTTPVVEGTDFTYNIAVTNSGPNPATGVQLDFSWGPNADLVSVGGSDNCTIDRTRLTCPLGTLNTGTSVITVVVRPRSGGTLSSRAGVTGTTADPNPANNAAFVETTVTPGASTLVVTNTNDSGPGSLFQAMFEANDPGPRDRITFNIPGAGPHTITPTTRLLPTIDQPVEIDATTQPGYTGTPLIEISGQNAGPNAGLVINGSNTVIRGLAINRFSQAGIALGGAGGHTVEANFIGTNPSGTAALANQAGIFVNSPNNLIGGTGAARNLISGNTVQGVIILSAAATGNVVSGNFIGSNVSGSARIPNGGAGVAVTNGASNNTIGGTTAGAGNLISGNTGPGVNINTAGTTGNTVAGNFIGTNAAGSAALFNGNSGVVLNTGTTNNTVGGTTAAARNVISGNNQSGVNIAGTGTTANTVAGNYIGTNAAGSAAIANGNNGITISAGATNTTVGGTASGAGNIISGNPASGIAVNNPGTTGTTILGNFIGMNAAGTAAIGNGHGVNIVGGASNTTVGGTASGARNILSGNSGYGVRIADAGTSGNRVLGNFVGTNAAGAAAIPNGLSGVFTINGASGNTIGGTQPAEGNVISGNASFGVAFFGAATDGGNTVLNNFIGTDAAGTAAIGNNASGIFVETSNNRIGSLTEGVGNTIAFNGDVGVRVGAGTGNAIVNNRIFSNASLGIDLAPLGVTPNDVDDADVGPNNLLNFPVLSSARTVGSDVRVQVNLTPPPSGPFQVHFYASPSCDASGAGEGATPIGVATLSGSPNPSVNFEMIFPVSMVPAGSILTATTTDGGNNTSEFSLCQQVDATAGEADLEILMTESPDPAATGSPLTYTISVNNLGPDAASNVIVTDVLPSNVTFVSATASIGSCATSGTTTITVTCTIGTIAFPGSVSVGVVVTPTAPATLTNTATVSASGTEPVAANNSATTTTIVNAAGPTIYVVTNTNQSGDGSLRQAILDANAHLGPDLIHFDIPGTGVRQILAVNLPAITDPVTIDGTSQPGWAVDRPIVMLSGVEAPAGANGLVIGAGNSVVRALIISRYTGSGVVLQGGDVNVVEGNWLGTGPDGTTAFGNGNGILVLSSGNTIGGNVISGNTNGVQIGLGALGNAIHANLIGTDVSGTLDVGNTEAGVLILGEANAIGGPNAAARNVISGNDQAGVRLTGGASANTVAGNFIGTDRAGTNPLGNGIGVQVGVNVDGTASTNMIGGLTADAANQIAFNTTIGVVVGQSSSDNAILGNSIHHNGTLGIDLIGNGVTPNDPGDADEGANNLTNFPELAAAIGGVQGTLNSIPDTTFRIEFFGNTACDASGNGEGALFLGATAVTTDGTGNATIPFFAAAAGQVVTATATDSSNNTSEFSNCAEPLGASAELAVMATDSPDPVILGTQLGYSVTLTNNGPSPATDARISFVWNAAVSIDAATPSQGTCEMTPLLVCSFGTVADDASVTVGIAVRSNVIGPLTATMTAQADESDPVPGNNAVAVNTNVIGGPSSFIVTNTDDAGAGSLRQAIESANASVGTDLITFAIPGVGVVHTINLQSPLPTITETVTIDGTSQTGFSGSPLIELNGFNAGPTANGLIIDGNSTTVQALVINRFGTEGQAGSPGGSGIVLRGAGSHRVWMMYIGTNPAGTEAVFNRGDGIVVDNSPNNLIGGESPFANVISGNGRSGILLTGTGTLGTNIVSNFIGTNRDGTVSIGNPYGVRIEGAPSNFVGGTFGNPNIISGNSVAGVAIVGSTAQSNTIGPNLIGTSAGGLFSLGNGDGVSVSEGASNNLIGHASVVSQANVIRFNAQVGVRIESGTQNAIRNNRISDNGLLGIDLDGDGVTANDSGDVDTGANGLQNFPVLSSVSGGVQATLNSIPNTTFRIEFFANAACDASGNGEGATFLGTTTVTTDVTGNGTIPLFTAAGGQLVAATATDSSNNTSEFSSCVQAGGQPALTSVVPASAAQGVTLDVALSGVNTTFASGTTTVGFGAGIAVNSVTVTSPTSATANITVSPTAFTGGRTVTVTTGTEVVTNAFAVTAGAALLSAVSPTSGQQGQTNLNLTVTGQNTHFVQDVTTATLGGGVIVNLVTVHSPTSATVNISIEPFAQDARVVVLTTGGENAASAADAFQILPGTPRLTSVAPGSGQQGQTLTVSVVGQFTSFVNGTTTASFGPGITVNAVNVISATTANVNISISALANVSSRTVTLTTGGQVASSLDAGSFFSVTRGPAAINQVNPASGRQAEGLSVTVTGTSTHFATGSTVFSFGGGITVTNAVINSPTNATLNIAILPGAALGVRTVMATTLGEVAELANGFTVDGGLAAIATVSPSTGRQAERLNLNVTGQFTHFVDGTTIASVGAGITVHAVTVTNPTSATLDVTVSPGAALGARTVVLTTGAEVAQLVGGFTVTPGQPTLFSINPVSAIQGTNLTVILNGAFTNFTPQVTTAFFGTGISVGAVTVNGPTLASVPISVAAGATVGPHSVTVTTGSESVTLLNGFTVVQGTPTVTSIDPNAGQQGLTRNVAITGVFTNWQNTVTSVSYGAGITVNSNVVNSATSLTNNITIDADATLGPRDVVITTGTEVLTVPGGFTVTNVDVTAPTLLRLSPASGSTGVPLNTAVTAEFSEPLSRTTVTPATFQLYDTVTGQYIATTVSARRDGTCGDADAESAARRQSYPLRLSQQPDHRRRWKPPPRLLQHLRDGLQHRHHGADAEAGQPAELAIRRWLGTRRSCCSSIEPINTATLGIGMRLQTGGVNVPGTFVLEDGQQRIRFTPASQLAASAAYVLTLTSELRDVAGNALTNPGTISFTTGPDNDTTAPTVTASTPYYNEADVSRRPVIRAAFSEQINPISLTSSSFYLYNYYTNALIRATISHRAGSPERDADTGRAPRAVLRTTTTTSRDLRTSPATMGAPALPTSSRADSKTRNRRRSSRSPRPTAATGVPVNARVRVLMSEPIDATSVSAAIQLTPAVRRHDRPCRQTGSRSLHARSEPGGVDRLYGAGRRAARFGRQHDGAGRSARSRRALPRRPTPRPRQSSASARPTAPPASR